LSTPITSINIANRIVDADQRCYEILAAIKATIKNYQMVLFGVD
jgi:hypothetical protein